MNQALLIDVAPYAGNDDDDVRYTLDDADAWLRDKAGVPAWDLDAAGCHESHRAQRYYTLERSEDGLVLPWAPRTFINPPWSNIAPWIDRAWDLMTSEAAYFEVLAFLLPLRTHMGWWQKRIEPNRWRGEGGPLEWRGFGISTHHPPARFRYGAPGNPRGVGVVEPNFQTVGVLFQRTS